MANRIEREFPAVRWQPVPSRGVDHELVRHYVERGRELRSEAIRRSGRAALDGLRHGLARIAALVRCTALTLAGRPDRSDCWRRSLRGA